MCLEGADGSFGDVTMMGIRGNKLELHPPLILDVELLGCTTLVVKDLEVKSMATLCEAGHDLICGGKTVAVMGRFEWPHQDYIGVHIIGDDASELIHYGMGLVQKEGTNICIVQ